MGTTGDHFYTTSEADRDNAVRIHGYVLEGIAAWVPGPHFQTDQAALFRLANPGNGDHFYTTSAAERDSAVNSGGYVSEGVACRVSSSAEAGTVPMFRLANPGNGDHFYTTSAAERDDAVNSGMYVNEGVACHVFSTASAGTVQLFRLFDAGNGDHFYTTSAAERDGAVNSGDYVYEGVSCHVFPAANRATQTQLFQMFDAGNGDHFYTTSAAERDGAVNSGDYVSEGIACDVFSHAEFGTVPLFRLANHDNGDHFYTISAAERDSAISSSMYAYEGVACYVFPSTIAGTRPLFRLFKLYEDIVDVVTLDKEITSGTLEGLSGWVTMSIFRNGDVRFYGWANAGGLESYDFTVAAVVRASDGVAIVATHSGHVAGTLEGPDPVRTDRWDSTEMNPLVSHRFSQFHDAHLELTERHTGNIGTAFVELFDLVVKWSIGSALDGVTLGTLIVVGEAASLVTTGSLVPGARLVEGFLWLAGPDGTLFAMAAEAGAAAGSKMRDLTQAEFDFVDRVFEGTLPRERIVLTDTIGGHNRQFTFPRFDGKISINIGPADYPDPSESDPGTLIHELTHAWQIANAPVEVVWLGAALKDMGSGNYLYNVADLGVKPWEWFGIEQQAQIVQDWFTGHKSDLTATKALEDKRFQYIAANIRTGTT